MPDGLAAAGSAAGTPPASLRQALALATQAGRGLLVANLSLRVLQGVLPLLGLVAMQQFLDAVAAGIGSADAAVAWRAVTLAVGFALAVAVAGAVLGGLGSVLGERHARRVVDGCALRLQRHAAALDLLQIEDPGVGDLLHRASAEVGQRPVRIVQNLSAAAMAAVTLLAMAGTLATISPLLAGCIAALSLPQVLVRMRHARRQLDWQHQRTPAQRRLAYLGGLLVGRHVAKDLRANGLAAPIERDVARLRSTLTEEQLVLQRRRVIAETMAQLLATGAVFGGYLYLGGLAFAGTLTIGMLLLHAQATQRLQNGVRDTVLAVGAMREDRLFLQQYFAFLAVRPRVVAPAAPVAVPAPPAPLACRSVRFGYPQAAAPILHDVSFALHPGERVGLLGANGAGKSTLVRLLTRLCDPDAGAIEFGGVDLRELEPERWRARLSVFFQDAARLELTARSNLDYDAPRERDEALLTAADRVGIGDWLRALPQGLDTPLGRTFAGSVEASAGQWRRMLLARTLLRDADVVILDEPFAFLDAVGQRQLAAALATGMGDRAVLVIEHRAELLAGFDRLLVLEQGRIVADGPPQAVLGAR